jgi:hypothetical protein
VPFTVPPAQLRWTERWFVRHGTPTMIEGYGFPGHVLPRMLPVLGLGTVAGLAWLVLTGTVGSWRWAVLAGVVVVATAVWVSISAHVRRRHRASRTTTVAVLAAYAATPVAVPLLQVAVDGTVTPPGVTGVGLPELVLLFAAAFGSTLLATTYGVGTLLRRALRHAVDDLRNSVHLLGRALPGMLFVTLFLFFTGELWQAMNRLGWERLALVVTLFGAVTVLAAAARLRDEIGRVEQDLSPPRLAAAARETPLAGLPFDELTPGGHLRATPLSGRQERNLLLVLATRQLVQAAVVGLALFAFFIVLGVLVVVPETAEQWIGAPPVHSALVPGIPVAMLRTATLFAAFGSMYFAVTSMSDADHRQQFFAPIIDEIERTLAVRAVYLAVHHAAEPGGGPAR